MSEQGFYEEEDVQDQVQQPRDPVRSHLKKLEQENKELRQLKADAEAAKKKLAFVEAGVDLSSPVAEYFIKGYDGEISTDAINLSPGSRPGIPQPAGSLSLIFAKQELQAISPAASTEQLSFHLIRK